MGVDEIFTWQVTVSDTLREAFNQGDAEAQRRAAEQHAIDSLAAAYKAMKKAADTDDTVKGLYAEEIMDILRRIRGGHGGD